MIVLCLFIVFIVIVVLAMKALNGPTEGSVNSETNVNSEASSKPDEKVYYKLAVDLFKHKSEAEREAICSQYSQSEIESAKVVLKQMEESEEYRNLIMYMTDAKNGIEEDDDNPIKNN